MGTEIRSIPLENLLIDLQNPRYDPRTSQREAISTIAHDQRGKLVNLAEDIVERGLNPSELIVVLPTEEPNIYSVLEGNRRIAALKLVSSPTLISSLGLSQSLTKRYNTLVERGKDTLPKEVSCVVLSREDANYWIRLKHTGENEGVGIVMWDGRSKHRFRGSSPALQAIELVENTNLLDVDTRAKLPRIAITNIERLLNTPDARKLLGIDVKNNQLSLISSEEEGLGRLAIIVKDVANKQIKVTDLDTKEQRIKYAQEILKRPLPKSVAGKSPTSQSAKEGARPKKPPQPDRKNLIPRTLKLVIAHTRLAKIYDELQKLNVDDFRNACAVLLRVFLELSLDNFAQHKKISLKTIHKSTTGTKQDKDMTLREKIRTIADYLEHNNMCTKQQLRGIRSIVANREHFLSVDTLNAYVHNKDYNPSPTELKVSWDNIEIFMQQIWSI